jgi:leucyl/phenylalanyl-tRNA--protein transferase
MNLVIPEEFFLDAQDAPFPDIDLALDEPNGLIAIGGDLSSQRLINAYQQGIFPWYGENEPVLWYAPNPRMIMTPEALHISKSLNKVVRSRRFEIKINHDFDSVIYHCKSIKRKDQDSTWIDENMVRAYTKLHTQGVVKSVEVYQDSKLVGGLYGVSMEPLSFLNAHFPLDNQSTHSPYFVPNTQRLFLRHY